MLILAMTDGLSNAQALELPNANRRVESAGNQHLTSLVARQGGNRARVAGERFDQLLRGEIPNP